jgi:hypothetical protein
LRARAEAAALRPEAADPDPSVTSGEVDMVNYRMAKQAASKLQKSLSAREPAEQIAARLIALALHAGQALGRYPAHAELRGWFDRAEALRKELPEATRREFGLESPLVAATTATSSGLYADEPK